MYRREIQLFAGILLIAALAGPCSAGAFCPFGDSGGSSSSDCSLFSEPFPAPVSCSFGDMVTSGITVDPFQSADSASSVGPCPFDDSGTNGPVDPFQPNDPSAFQPPCPFDDPGSTGAGETSQPFDLSDSQEPCPFNDGGTPGSMDDPFQLIDPASIVVPCPFPRQSGQPGELYTESAAGDAWYPDPLDPDNDGCYEDLNGNGHIDFADVILYFGNMEWIRSNEPVPCFDYNGNGNIDFADLIVLFHDVGH